MSKSDSGRIFRILRAASYWMRTTKHHAGYAHTSTQQNLTCFGLSSCTVPDADPARFFAAAGAAAASASSFTLSPTSTTASPKDDAP